MERTAVQTAQQVIDVLQGAGPNTSSIGYGIEGERHTRQRPPK